MRSLPVVNFLDIKDQKYVEVLLQEVLPEDSTRLRKYLSHRALGLGIVVAVCLMAFPPFLMSIF